MTSRLFSRQTTAPSSPKSGTPAREEELLPSSLRSPSPTPSSPIREDVFAKLIDGVQRTVTADLEKQNASPERKPTLAELVQDATDLELSAQLGVADRTASTPGSPRSPGNLRKAPTQQQIEDQEMFPATWMKRAFRQEKVPPKVILPPEGFNMTSSALARQKYVPGHDVFRGMYHDIRGPEPPRVDNRARNKHTLPAWDRFKASRFSGGHIFFAEGADLVPVGDGGRLLMEYNPETLTCNVCEGQKMRCQSCESALKYSVWKARAAADIKNWEAGVRPQTLEDLQRKEVMLAARLRQLHDARKEREALVPLYEGEAQGINKKYREVSLVIEEASRFTRQAKNKFKGLQENVENALAENMEIRKMLTHVRERMDSLTEEGAGVADELPKGKEMKKFLKEAIIAMNQKIRSIRRDVNPEWHKTTVEEAKRGANIHDLVESDVSGLAEDRSNLEKFPPDVQHRVMKADLQKLEDRRRALLRWGDKEVKGQLTPHSHRRDLPRYDKKSRRSRSASKSPSRRSIAGGLRRSLSAGPQSSASARSPAGSPDALGRPAGGFYPERIASRDGSQTGSQASRFSIAGRLSPPVTPVAGALAPVLENP